MNRTSGAILTGFLCAGLMACGGGGTGNNPPPMLSLSTQTLLFGAFLSVSTNPAPASASVTNTGGGTLMFTATSDSPWLNVTPANGTAPTTLQISAALGAPPLTAGTYIGHITVTANGAQGSPGMITVTFTVGSGVASTTPFWAQWGANPQHAGMVNVAGQSVGSKLVDIVYDPFVSQEEAENAPSYGEPVLTVHEQAPITDGNDVYMVAKSGSYNSCNPVGNWMNGAACGPNTWNTMWWNEVRYSWLNGQFLQVWDFESDWVPEPNATTNYNGGLGGLYGWEPVFHPADTANFIYVPGASGQVWKVNKTTGASVSHINPFSGNGSVNAMNTFVAGPLTADANGNIYYNVIELNINGNPWDQNDVMNAWLVKIAPDDTATIATFASLTPGAPAGTSLTCPGNFYFTVPQPPFPWPPSPTAVAPFYPAPCGSQRPGINVAPAVSADGMTVYTASKSHFDSMPSYLVAANTADLSPKWAASLQNRLTDGCGVLLPIAGPGVTNLPNSCLNGTTVGVDPTTNTPGSGNLSDQASSSPTVLPDGSVVLGAVDNYNYARGHLFRFNSDGTYIGSYGFGWDSTPGVWVHDGTFSVVIKDNHAADEPAYCTDSTNPVCTSTAPAAYYISQLDSNLNVQWSFQNTSTDASHPNGFEWCINMPAIDMNGNVYVNSEDGNIYELPQGKTGVFTAPTGKLFLNLAIGAAYTPLSIGPDGKLYTQNNGHLFVVGN